MQKLNSDNTPLRIDFLPAHITQLSGRIGMTIAPGKCAAGINGIWERNLSSDLARIRDLYGIDLIICLLEDHELNRLKISELPHQVVNFGLKMHRHAIPDGGVPESQQQLHETVSVILQAAEKGQSVMIHCRGGLGRSGLIAACCLVALGKASDDAMAIVRASRHHAIENRQQEQAIRDYQKAGYRHDSSLESLFNRPSLDRFLGCLFGGAIGDALGYPVEFVKERDIVAQYGKHAPVNLDYAHDGRALVSDDTQMTLFVAEGIIRSIQRFNDRGLCSVPCVIENALIRWYKTQTTIANAQQRSSEDGWLKCEQRLYVCRAPGNTCLSALASLSKNHSNNTKLNNSKGCGAVMRSAPIGLGAGSREIAFEVACHSGAQTHGHPLGYLPAGYLAALIFDLKLGMSLSKALDCADTLLESEAIQGKSPFNSSDLDTRILNNEHRQGACDLLAWTSRARQAAASWNSREQIEIIEQLGKGWVGEEALAIAICCALAIENEKPDDVAHVLWASIAHGGDSDSTGAITGNIVGTMMGVDALPKSWIERVELCDIIDRLSRDLFASTVLGHELSRVDYPPN